jgi:hypothetical protein
MGRDGGGVRLYVEALPCRADANASGAADIDDIFIYLNAWFAADPRADMSSPPSGVSIDDIFIYLNLWFAGC